MIPTAFAWDAAAAAVQKHYACMVASDASRDAKEVYAARTIANQRVVAIAEDPDVMFCSALDLRRTGPGRK